MMLKRDNLQPGDMVSIDQYYSAALGRLPNTKGKESKKDKYCGGTLFVDHASSLVFLKHQVSLRAGDTVMSKKEFERKSAEVGVRIKGYHADNVPFDYLKNFVRIFKRRIRPCPYPALELTIRMVLPRGRYELLLAGLVQ